MADRTKTKAQVLSVSVLALASKMTAAGAIITVPSGLAPGDHYRLMFITDVTRDGTSSNIADYNAFVTADALAHPELAALNTSWNAIVSTPTVSAAQNADFLMPAPMALLVDLLPGGTALTVPAANPAANGATIGGKTVVIQSADFASLGLLPPIFTGSTADGNGLSGDTLGAAMVGQGQFTQQGTEWISSGSLANSNTQSYFYGISGELTVPAGVPEPGTLALVALGAGVFVFGERRGRGGRARIEGSLNS